MSVWKKASKAHQVTHKERHQPEHRKHLGLLEKKKDYVKRARDYNEKKETLKVLKKRALNKNPDEFYHHMINSKIEKGIHVEKQAEDEDTPEQIKLMRTQDYKYIVGKRTQEQKKIEKLQAQLHMSSIKHNLRNKHIYFNDNLESRGDNSVNQQLSERELPDVNVECFKEATKQKKALYNELGKRINREKELAIIQQKIEVQRHLDSKKSVLPPKKIKKGTKNQAPVYVWKYERKK